MDSKTPYILGLDLGTNSIGWAVVACKIHSETDDDNNKKTRLEPTSLIDFNSRIFQEMMEVKAKTKVPKNKHRREMRLMRRRLARRKGARRALIRMLIEAKLLPVEMRDCKDCEGILNSIDRKFAERLVGKSYSKDWGDQDTRKANPFAMRALGLDERLEPYEFGRVLLQLQQRRGYRSNRGAKYIKLLGHPRVKDLNKPDFNDENQSGSENQDKDEAKDEAKERQKVLGGISRLKDEMDKIKCRTLGEFIWKKAEQTDQHPSRITKYYVDKNDATREKSSRICLYAEREMYEEEFDCLWKANAEKLSLTNQLRKDIYDKIFYQRDLKLQKNLVGKCSFLTNKSRATKALLEVQEFRMRAIINNIQINSDATGRGEPIDENQREDLFRALHNGEQLNSDHRLAWQKVKKILGQQRTKLNLEEKVSAGEEIDEGATKKGLIGNTTHAEMQKIIPEQWQEFDDSQKQALMEDLLTIHNKRDLFEKLINTKKNSWQRSDGTPYFTDQEAFDLAVTEFEEGYARHCLKVINSLLPHLRNGLRYDEACQKENYLRKDQKEVKGRAELGTPQYIANPIVQKALYEVRRVVNSIIKEYGKPEEIKVELSREMRASKKRRAEREKEQRANQKLNAEIEEALRAEAKNGNPNITLKGGRPSSRDRLRYKLWLELGGAKAKCPYSDVPISSLNQALSVDVDHIVPRSLSNDNSYLNKILCDKDANNEKGQKTPYQKWGNTEKYEEIIRRMKERIESAEPRYKKALRKKLKKMQLQEIPDGFTEAQLKATQHIAVATKNYLETLGVTVDVSNGRATAEVRRLWGLNKVLPQHPDLEEDEEEAKPADSKKKDAKSRLDHRHHAIDALVVALTDRSVYKNMQCRYRYSEKNEGRFPDTPLQLPESWEEQDVQRNREEVRKKIMGKVVSYMADRKIKGSLHKANPFGRSRYNEEFELKTHGSCINKGLGELLKYRPDEKGEIDQDGDIAWVPDLRLYEKLKEWRMEMQQKKKLSERKLPSMEGKVLDKITIAKRCYVKRIPLDKKALEYVDKDWIPGKGRWIKSESTYRVLSAWLKENTEGDLESNPPKMPNRNNPERSNPIKHIRIAEKKTDGLSICRLNDDSQFFDLENWHHVVIFECIQEQDGHRPGNRKWKFVSMLEAAERASAYRRLSKDDRKGEAVIQRRPENFGLDSRHWSFIMDLASNDLVIFDKEDVPPEHMAFWEGDSLIYRVQKMSGAKGNVTFRHHSVSSTDDKDKHGQLIKTVKSIKCKKIQIDMLGNWFVPGQNDKKNH